MNEKKKKDTIYLKIFEDPNEVDDDSDEENA